MSNTLYFESIGWTGLLVEAVPHLAAQCRLDRPRSVTINVAVVGPMDRGPVTIDVVSAAEFLSKRSEKSVAENYALPAAETSQIETIDVTGSTMDDVLSAARLASIDFMTIDVEGGEWGVLQGFTIGHWNPRFVLIERNEDYFDPRIRKFMKLHGYLLVRRTGVNDWYEYRPAEAQRARSRMRVEARWILTTHMRRIKHDCQRRVFFTRRTDV